MRRPLSSKDTWALGSTVSLQIPVFQTLEFEPWTQVILPTKKTLNSLDFIIKGFDISTVLP